jgi:hypothetical protein
VANDPDHWKRYQAAVERASRYAPPPRHLPINSGICGVAATAFIVAIFSGAAGGIADRAPFAVFVTMAVGFLGPFLHFRSIEQAHIKAVSTELRRTDETQ